MYVYEHRSWSLLKGGRDVPCRAVAARSEVVRLNSSVGLPAVRRNARQACC